ncbi:MAG: type II secretion system secretin GspD [Steroidobacteraceae bacterium]
MRRKRAALPVLLALSLGTLAVAQQSSQRITPNFRDADITQIIDAVSAITNKTIIVDPRVRAQVTMLSTTPMTPEQFYQAFLSILQVHGFVAVPAGNVIKILPDSNMRQLPGNDLPDRVSGTSDEVVTQIVPVRNVNPAQLVPVLRQLMPQNAQLQAVTGANMLVISDRASNVNRLMRIISRIDQGGNADIDVIPLQSATAADTVRVLNSLLAGQGENASTVRIVADDRSNSILISGDQNQRLRVKTLIAHLDTPADSGSETQVRYLRYADAETLATKLKEQMSTSASGNSSSSSTNRYQNQNQNQNQNSTTPVNAPGINSNGQNNAAGANGATGATANNGSTTTSGVATLSLAGGTATIWSDKDTNSLVITAAARTMRALMSVIDKLDIRRAQVQVDAIIAEVSSDKSSELGVNWVIDGTATGVAAGSFVSGVGSTQSNSMSIYDLYETATGSSTTVPLGTTLAIGRLSATGISFAAMIRALQGDSRTNILGRPSIITQDNQEAKIQVAQEVPFKTGEYTTSSSSTTTYTTIQRQEVGTILTVTPQINEGDSVILKIEVESSSLASDSSGAVDLITNKRTISTQVLIPDGGTLVLGGLIQDKVTNTEQRVPLLGSIPILGELFRTRSTEKTKSNLMVFIQPRILRDDRSQAIETEAKYNYLRDEQREANKNTVSMPFQPFAKPDELPPLKQPASATGSADEKSNAPTPAGGSSSGAATSPGASTQGSDSGTSTTANPTSGSSTSSSSGGSN